MKTYSKAEETLLSSFIRLSDVENGFRWKDLLNSLLKLFAVLFVSAERLYRRGRDMEEQTLTLTKDKKSAWKMAAPYYQAAYFKHHAEAAYRFAQYWDRDGWRESMYSLYLEWAAKWGSPAAIRDFVCRYDEFKAKTITRDAWRRQQSQIRTYFRCCRLLSDKGDPEILWKLGTCYLNGDGVRQDREKGLQFRDRALALWKENGEVREVPALLQKLEKECHPEKDEPRGRFWLSALNSLFSQPELDDEEESDSGSEA